jgi:PAS domain-containing protein
VIDLDVLQEPTRLDALRRLALANLEPEEPFDRLTRLAAFICSAPTALLTFVDHRTEYFKSAQGLPPALADLRRVSLDYSICRYAVAAGGPLVVSDARNHPLLATHPAVTELGVVAYAGVPLITSTGQCLGAIAVLDWAPRTWGDEQVARLRDLAATAVTELELRRELTDRGRMEHALRESEARYRSLIEQTSDIITVIDESAVVQYGSPSVTAVLGYDPADLVGRRAVDLVHPDDVGPVLEAHRSALRDPTEAPSAASGTGTSPRAGSPGPSGSTSCTASLPRPSAAGWRTSGRSSTRRIGNGSTRRSGWRWRIARTTASSSG